MHLRVVAMGKIIFLTPLYLNSAAGTKTWALERLDVTLRGALGQVFLFFR